jgi:hypothetical protein
LLAGFARWPHQVDLQARFLRKAGFFAFAPLYSFVGKRFADQSLINPAK